MIYGIRAMRRTEIMLWENEDTVNEKIKEQERDRETYKIHDGLLYHYASYDTLWRILDSDSFFARNIRFSNDANEYMTGKSAIKEFVEGKKRFNDPNERNILLQEIQNNPMNYFMICFCEDGDLLSQWRGYAKNGVSIGLDFKGGYRNQGDIEKHVEFFCVVNNKRFQEETAKDKMEFNYKYYLNEKDTGIAFVQMPYKVQYISKDNVEITDKILSELYDSDFYEDYKDGADKLIKCIPFLKDKSFEEEKEHRLIFDMEYLGGSRANSDYVCSKKVDYLEIEGIRKPYINVEFGKPQNKLKHVVNICVGKDVLGIKDILERANINKGIVVNEDNKRDGIYIGEGSNQEDIMTQIEKYIETPEIPRELKTKVKIWCEGHLPIREIMVGPSKKQQDIKESLEFYKKTVYWMKYIDIKESKIPLRD